MIAQITGWRPGVQFVRHLLVVGAQPPAVGMASVACTRRQHLPARHHPCLLSVPGRVHAPDDHGFKGSGELSGA
ncbi:hypothetical protein KHQ06_02325 [Nocardia tengchongensis]|uniref:Uncharacterized protein n=1 Tax=Nocardia tengchongensis TaxID=2055889 RepID=A0ABX8CT22_9NOCA|nr:hypothetical protein [Nocardia tengchongensis]QVI22014.1 hypothetical protein KHQ06_02325 [Nocardia tengchongensis]